MEDNTVEVEAVIKYDEWRIEHVGHRFEGDKGDRPFRQVHKPDTVVVSYHVDLFRHQTHTGPATYLARQVELCCDSSLSELRATLFAMAIWPHDDGCRQQ